MRGPPGIVKILESQNKLSTQLLTMRSEITECFVKAKEAADRAAEGAARVNDRADELEDQADRIEDLLRKLLWAMGALVVLVIGILGVLV